MWPQMVLVLDGLEMLGENGGGISSGLRDWLPEKLPAGCRVILGVGDTKSTGFMVLKRIKVNSQPGLNRQSGTNQLMNLNRRAGSNRQLLDKVYIIRVDELDSGYSD